MLLAALALATASVTATPLAQLKGAGKADGSEMSTANKLVDRANAAIESANQKIEISADKIEAMNAAVKGADGEKALKKRRAEAKAIIADLENASAGYLEASNKFTEASLLKVRDEFKTYLDLKAKEMKKRGEITATLIADPQALINSPSVKAYRRKVAAVTAKLQGLQKVANDLEAKADRLYEENRDLFKTPAYETGRANQLVDVANAAIQIANQQLSAMGDKLSEMEAGARQVEDEPGLAKLRAQARTIIAGLERARDNYTAAGNRFAEAGRLRLKDKFREYLEIKGKEMMKRGELTAALIAEPQALIDSKSADDYQKKAADVLAQVRSLQKEASDLEARADAIYNENKALFKQP